MMLMPPGVLGIKQKNWPDFDDFLINFGFLFHLEVSALTSHDIGD